ncbi:hypothetical protein MIR68_002217 [Amoeboaphelidium protococcarum]|nr:hypothetical protein MIR68_002217 [Amoeboaphelidium protococcarum]
MESTIKNLQSRTSSAKSPASKVLDVLQNGTIESGQRLTGYPWIAARSPVLTPRSHSLRHCERLGVKLLTHNGKTHAKHLPTALGNSVWSKAYIQVISNCAQVIYSMCCSILTDRIAQSVTSKQGRASQCLAIRIARRQHQYSCCAFAGGSG